MGTTGYSSSSVGIGKATGLVELKETVEPKDAENNSIAEAEEIKEITDVEMRCPKSSEHRVNKWTYPGSCPKCGESMTTSGLFINWD